MAMEQMNKGRKMVLGLITARAGSKGIIGKNLVDLAGKPLIQWTIEAALAAESIDEVFVSSDGDDILTLAAKLGAQALKRPAELSQDLSRSEDAVIHALSDPRIQGRFEHVILLQPTSPLRTAEDIDSAMSLTNTHDCDSVISVYEPDHHPLKSFTLNQAGYLQGAVNNEYPFSPRQELPTAYYPNGAIYIVQISRFLHNHSLFQEKTLGFPMSREKSIDIDAAEDIKRAEAYLNEFGIAQ